MDTVCIKTSRCWWFRSFAGFSRRKQEIDPNDLQTYGYGSIPIHTIFRGMNINLPAILMFTRGIGFWPIHIFPARNMLFSRALAVIILSSYNLHISLGLFTRTIQQHSPKDQLLKKKQQKFGRNQPKSQWQHLQHGSELVNCSAVRVFRILIVILSYPTMWGPQDS